MRKVVDRCPKTGVTRERYVDMGPRSAVPGHGQPVMRNVVATGGGSKLMRLGSSGRGRA